IISGGRISEFCWLIVAGPVGRRIVGTGIASTDIESGETGDRQRRTGAPIEDTAELPALDQQISLEGKLVQAVGAEVMTDHEVAWSQIIRQVIGVGIVRAALSTKAPRTDVEAS